MNIICQSLYYQYILDKFHFFKSPKTFRVIITIILYNSHTFSYLLAVLKGTEKRELNKSKFVHSFIIYFVGLLHSCFVFYFLIDGSTSEIINYICTEWHRNDKDPDVAFIGRQSGPLNCKLVSVSHSFKGRSYGHCWRLTRDYDMKNSNKHSLPLFYYTSVCKNG